jgi:type I restriction enzyme S subunit
MTEIGEMPEEWILKNLGDNEISLIKMGQSPPSGTYNKAGDGLPFLQGNAEFGVKHPSFTIYCSLPLKITQPGDILISVRAPVGDVNIANSKYCIGRGLATIRSNPRSMDGLFLYYTLNHFKLLLERISTGSTFKAIGKEQLHSLKIPLPKIVEQQKIAEILTTVDRKIELLNEKKKEAEKLKRGLMDKLLTGKVRVKV